VHTGYALDREFTMKLGSLVVSDPGFGRCILTVLDPDLLPHKDCGLVFSVWKHYMETEGEVPSRAVSKQLLLQRFHQGSVTQEAYTRAVACQQEIWKTDPVSRPTAQSVLRALLLETETWSALDEGLRLYKDRKYTEVYERMDVARGKLSLIESTSLGTHMNMDLEDYLTRLRRGEARVQRMPIGIAELDLRLKGGLGRGELGCFLGAEKVGKSMALVHTAATAVLAGLNAIYISAELSQLAVQNRFTANVTGISVDALEAGEEIAVGIVEERLRRVLKKVGGGQFVVKAYPSGVATVRDIEAYLRDVKRHWDVSPDTLIVDYADELAPEQKSKYMDSGSNYHAMGNIYTALHALSSPAEEITHGRGGFNCAVWTASQVQRAAVGKELLEFTDVAESILKAAKVDLMVALCRTDDEREADLMRFYIPCCRFAGFPVEVGPFARDYAHGRIVVLDEFVHRFGKKQEVPAWEKSISVVGLSKKTPCQTQPKPLLRPTLLPTSMGGAATPWSSKFGRPFGIPSAAM